MENNVRMILIAGTDNPLSDDSWSHDQAVPVELETEQEILKWAESLSGNKFNSIFLYQGVDYRGEVNELLHGGIKYDLNSKRWEELVNDPSSILLRELLFSPFERNCKLLRKAIVDKDDSSTFSEWRREIAMEEGMLNGIDSYNDWMGW